MQPNINSLMTMQSNQKYKGLVSAWATEHRLVLGQIKVADKSNEIAAIPALLELLSGYERSLEIYSFLKSNSYGDAT